MPKEEGGQILIPTTTSFFWSLDTVGPWSQATHAGLFPLRADVTPALSAVRDADKCNTAFARISTELGLEAHVPVAITPIVQHVMGWLRRACLAVSGAIGTVWRAHDIRGGKGFSAGLLTARMMVAVGFMCSVGARSFAAVLFDPRNLKFHGHHAVRQVIKSSDRSGYRAWLQSRAAERDLARCGYIFWDTSTLLSIFKSSPWASGCIRHTPQVYAASLRCILTGAWAFGLLGDVAIISFLNIQSRVIPRASIHQPFGLVKPQTDSLLLWFPSHKPRSDVALRRCNLTFISFHIFSPISARFALLQVELFIRDNVAPVYILTHLTYLFPCGGSGADEGNSTQVGIGLAFTDHERIQDNRYIASVQLLSLVANDLQDKSIRANQVQFHVRYRDAIARRLTLGQVGYPSVWIRGLLFGHDASARADLHFVRFESVDLNPDVFRWQVGGGGIGMRGRAARHHRDAVSVGTPSAARVLDGWAARRPHRPGLWLSPFASLRGTARHGARGVRRRGDSRLAAQVSASKSRRLRGQRQGAPARRAMPGTAQRCAGRRRAKVYAGYLAQASTAAHLRRDIVCVTQTDPRGVDGSRVVGCKGETGCRAPSQRGGRRQQGGPESAGYRRRTGVYGRRDEDTQPGSPSTRWAALRRPRAVCAMDASGGQTTVAACDGREGVRERRANRKCDRGEEMSVRICAATVTHLKVRRQRPIFMSRAQELPRGGEGVGARERGRCACERAATEQRRVVLIILLDLAVFLYRVEDSIFRRMVENGKTQKAFKNRPGDSKE
ncbi:hypothetical protein DFH06DRAFT_1373708 [Mycena polygramma]|nr:hypothetical protein DFH06DRAFT_1373708 [Mycena polygramma]